MGLVHAQPLCCRGLRGPCVYTALVHGRHAHVGSRGQPSCTRGPRAPPAPLCHGRHLRCHAHVCAKGHMGEHVGRWRHTHVQATCVQQRTRECTHTRARACTWEVNPHQRSHVSVHAHWQRTCTREYTDVWALAHVSMWALHELTSTRVHAHAYVQMHGHVNTCVHMQLVCKCTTR